LYLSVVEQRKNWAKALDVLKSKQGERFYQIMNERQEKEALLLKKMNNIKDAHKIYESLLITK
jgi:hypothetical protein